MNTKTTMTVIAVALLYGIGNVSALPPRILVEKQHTKIEPAIKKFQQKCSGHTDSQACKEEHHALVKALNEFLSLVQNGFKVIDAHANDASDADYQKQIAVLRAKAQQHLDWGANSSRRCNEEGIESHCAVHWEPFIRRLAHARA